MENKIKILIADDHPLIREGLKLVLEKDTVFIITGEAKNGVEALNILRRNKIDIAVLDIEMPLLSGFEVARKIREEKLNVKIVFLTMYKDEQMFNEAMEIGASGYVIKENAVENIVECIKRISEGFNYVSPALSHFLIKSERAHKELIREIPSINDLTKTERMILRMIGEDKTTNQIANELHISYKTTENHRNNISRKLQLKGTHSLIKFAINNKHVL